MALERRNYIQVGIGIYVSFKILTNGSLTYFGLDLDGQGVYLDCLLHDLTYRYTS